MDAVVFRERWEAGERLAEKLKLIPLQRPLVLAIPRGGVVTGAALAKKLGVELDVFVVKKLRCPWSSELAIGAIAEEGKIYLNEYGEKIKKENPRYVEEEIKTQAAELKDRVSKLRAVKPKIDRSHRTLILTDDGIATGSTFFVALEVLRSEHPFQLIAAVPVLPKEQVKALKKRCDKAVYLGAMVDFGAVGQFYENFRSVELEEVLGLLKAAERNQ